jgi:hypothetical protein
MLSEQDIQEIREYLELLLMLQNNLDVTYNENRLRET